MLTIIYNSILWNSSVCNATASRTLAKKKEIIGFIGHIFYPCNHKDIRRALINSQIDSIGLQFEEYLYISDHFETEHWFLTRTSSNLYEEYVLLAPVDGKIKQCEDLIGNNLIFTTHLDSPQKEKILTAFRELHTNLSGQQVLTILEAEALVEVEKKELSTTRNFVLEARKIP